MPPKTSSASAANSFRPPQVEASRLRAKVEVLESEEQRLKTEIDRLNAEKGRVNIELSTLSAKVINSQAEVDGLNTELEKLHEDYEGVVTESLEYQAIIHANQETYAESNRMRNALDDVNDILDELRVAMADMEVKHRETLERRDKEVREAKIKNVQDVAKWQGKVAALEKEIKALKGN